jgi:ArsR family transcriptional regulator
MYPWNMETLATSAAPTSELGKAVKQLAAIAHDGRLMLMKRLIQAGDSGESAGNLARSAGIGATTASAQLLVLANASLVRSHRRGRQVIYYAAYDSISGLLAYLLQDCCCGRNEICDPLFPAKTASHKQ